MSPIQIPASSDINKPLFSLHLAIQSVSVCAVHSAFREIRCGKQTGPNNRQTKRRVIWEPFRVASSRSEVILSLPRLRTSTNTADDNALTAAPNSTLMHAFLGTGTPIGAAMNKLDNTADKYWTLVRVKLISVPQQYYWIWCDIWQFKTLAELIWFSILQ